MSGILGLGMSIELLVTGIFVIFILGTVGAVFLRGFTKVRRFYISMFFISIILVNLMGVTVGPFVHLHKFSDAAGEQRTFYEIRVVDENGEELRYDARATGHFEEYQMQQLGEKFAYEWSEEEAEPAARHLLEQAEIYRSTVKSEPNIATIPRFPRHTLDYKWTESDLEGMSNFTSLRVYEITVEPDQKGTTATVVEQTEVAEFDLEESD